MIQHTIDELRKLKEVMIGNDDFTQDDLYTIDKAIIMCEQLRKARKKAKRWKRKHLAMVERIQSELNSYEKVSAFTLCYPAWVMRRDIGKIIHGEPTEWDLYKKKNDFPEHLDGIRMGNIIIDEWVGLSDKEVEEHLEKLTIKKK